MQPTDLRSHHLAKILNAVVKEPGELSRADLASKISLTKPTVSKLVDSLLMGDLIVEGTPVRRKSAGRPITPLYPAQGSAAGVGVGISADHISILVRDLSGKSLYSKTLHMETQEHPENTANMITGLLLEAVEALDCSTRLSGVTVAIPGRISSDGETVISAPGLGWKDVDLLHIFREAIKAQPLKLGNLPVPTLENDARLVARTELLSRTDESFLLVYGETGIGGAIVIDGNVFTGSLGWAGEIGHISVDPQGPICRCGRTGCLEAYASAWALKKKSGLSREVHISGLADCVPQDLFVEVGYWLGVAIADTITLLDVQQVVLAGYFSDAFDLLNDELLKSVKEHCLAFEDRNVSVQKARITTDSVLIGAAESALGLLLEDPAAWLDNF